MPLVYLRNRPTNQAEPRDDTIHDIVDTIDTVGIIQSAQIYERTRARYQATVNSMGISCYLYRKMTQGRKCSCLRKKVPMNTCPSCYGTSWVGGYTQYGHEKYVIDSTINNLDLNNLEIADGPDDDHYRPSPVILEGDTAGSFEIAEDFEMNGALAYNGHVLYGELPPRYGGSIEPYFWNPTASGWSALSTMGTYLTSLGAAPWKFRTRIRVEMKNSSPNGSIPCTFQALHLKWQVGDDTIKIEQASFDEVKNKLTDLGFIDETQGYRYTMWHRPRVSSKDFLVKANDGTRLKITTVKMTEPSDVPLSQDLSLRPIQDTEILTRVF